MEETDTPIPDQADPDLYQLEHDMVLAQIDGATTLVTFSETTFAVIEAREAVRKAKVAAASQEVLNALQAELDAATTAATEACKVANAAKDRVASTHRAFRDAHINKLMRDAEQADVLTIILSIGDVPPRPWGPEPRIRVTTGEQPVRRSRWLRRRGD